MGSRLGWVYKRAYDGINNGLRTVAGGRWAGHCRPTWIAFLLTERCNSRCVHCDIWQNRGREDGPSPEEWKAALLDIRRWLGPAHVCLTGGEALLKPFTVDLVRYGGELGLFIELLTHGYWENQQRIEEVALARPWRVTLSLDGIGETHDLVRGRAGFFEKTARTIETLKRMRAQHRLGFSIRLKTVLMAQNLSDAGALARFATQDGMDILYQAVEQNYASADDPRWWEHTENWPRDPELAAEAVRELIAFKRQGLAIANSESELEVMIPYFRDPDAWRLSMQSHSAHERRLSCSALSLLQVQSNGDVKSCFSAPAIGNIRTSRPREIWEGRPRWWESGCCLEKRASEAERERAGLPTLQA